MEEADWTAFASNVGRARLQRREAAEFRIRWVGALLLLLAVALLGFFAIRLYGTRAGWWSAVVPANHVGEKLHAAYTSAHNWVAGLFS